MNRAILVLPIYIMVLSLTGHSNTTDHYNKYPCLTCHEVMDFSVKHKAAQESCLNCHTRHGEKNSRDHFLKKNLNDLCLKCHKANKIHQSNEAIKAHPLKGKKSKPYPEKEFSCASCHTPHSGHEKYLFRYLHDETTPYQGNLCAVCHWNTVFDAPEPKTPEYRPGPRKKKDEK